MERLIRLAVISLCVAVLGSCAYTTAVPAPPGSKVSGIRIYDVKPILIVTADSYKIEMIPNYNRAYAVKMGAFLAKNDTALSLSNGIVTSVHAVLDSTAAIELFKIAAQRLIPDVNAQGTSGPTRSSVFAVYEFLFDDDGELVGLIPLPLGTYPPRVVANSDAPPAVKN